MHLNQKYQIPASTIAIMPTQQIRSFNINLKSREGKTDSFLHHPTPIPLKYSCKILPLVYLRSHLPVSLYVSSSSMPPSILANFCFWSLKCKNLMSLLSFSLSFLAKKRKSSILMKRALLCTHTSEAFWSWNLKKMSQIPEQRQHRFRYRNSEP